MTLRAWVDQGTMAMKGVHCIPQSPSIPRTLPSDCLVSYPEHSLVDSNPTEEKEFVCSTTPADWAKWVLGLYFTEIWKTWIQSYYIWHKWLIFRLKIRLHLNTKYNAITWSQIKTISCQQLLITSITSDYSLKEKTSPNNRTDIIDHSFTKRKSDWLLTSWA